MGGFCLYCGQACANPGAIVTHLQACLKFVGDKENLDGAPSLVSPAQQHHPPPEECGNKAGARRDVDLVLPAPKRKLPTTSIPLTCPGRIPSRAGADPATSTAKKHKGADHHLPTINQEYVLECLACGNVNCPYDDGHSVLDSMDKENQEEFDPSEPCLQAWKNSTGSDPARVWSFHELKGPITVSVAGVAHSKDFWANHKYLGSTSLDLKIQAWLKHRVEQTLLEDNWILLRRGVKEALRYKRQQSAEFIRSTFFGESSSSLPPPRLSLWLFPPFAPNQ